FLRRVHSNSIRLRAFFCKAFIPPAYAALGPHAFTVPSAPLVVDARPFIEPLGFLLENGDILMSAKGYRSSAAFCTCFSLPTNKWQSFWKFPLPYASRNVWYRLLHNKVPCRSVLHRLIPSFFPSATCLLCGIEEDTLEHFLWLCPIKLTVWSFIWSLYFDASSSTEALSYAITSLKFPALTSHYANTNSSSIFGSTLLSIWRAHWAFVFSDIPFNSHPIVAFASRLVELSQ
ncbi:hypothetical protein EDC96DRAFT_445189, partial [Choanephora cucurbitarum]